MSYSAAEQRKRALYERLLTGTANVRVTLELNPYFKIIQQQPLQLELTYCNVFFRHKHGDYYDQL